jgi:hypothetical protein
MTEDQKLINKIRVIYKALKKGSYEFKYGELKDRIRVVKWVLPNKFNIKIKHYSQEDTERFGKESYPILMLNTKTIEFITPDGKGISNGENMVLGSKITEIFKKHGITVYWSGIQNPQNDYTNMDITPKTK